MVSKLDEVKQSLDTFILVGNDIVTYLNFRFFLERIAKRANNGDAAASEIVARVVQVAKLITYTNSRGGG
jgi:hypothetical protein